MPMPNAIVATITRPSSRRKRAWCSARVPESSPAWYGRAGIPLSVRKEAIFSVESRDRQYTIPASPGCSVRRNDSNCLRGSFFGTIRYWMFGRSNDDTNIFAPASLSLMAISSRVAAVAVAVRAIRGTSGQRSCSTWSSR